MKSTIESLVAAIDNVVDKGENDIMVSGLIAAAGEALGVLRTLSEHGTGLTLHLPPCSIAESMGQYQQVVTFRDSVQLKEYMENGVSDEHKEDDSLGSGDKWANLRRRPDHS